MRTTDLIRESFYSLCKICAPDKISINSIVKKSGINRSTFYYYYENKSQLILTLQDEMLSSFFDILLYKKANKEQLIKEFRHLESPEVYAACFHIKENASIYKIWFNELAFIERFSNRLYEYLLDFSISRMHCAYFAYGTVGYFIQWIKNDCYGDSAKIANEILQISTQAFSDRQN